MAGESQHLSSDQAEASDHQGQLDDGAVVGARRVGGTTFYGPARRGGFGRPSYYGGFGDVVRTIEAAAATAAETATRAALTFWWGGQQGGPPTPPMALPPTPPSPTFAPPRTPSSAAVMAATLEAGAVAVPTPNTTVSAHEAVPHRDADWVVAATLTFTVLKDTTATSPWLVPPQALEDNGYTFVSSLGRGVLYIVDPNDVAHELHRRPDGIPVIQGFCPRRGLFCAGRPPTGQPAVELGIITLDMVADTGAAMPVAGGHYDKVLHSDGMPGRSAYGVGGCFVESVASGTCAIAFPKQPARPGTGLVSRLLGGLHQTLQGVSEEHQALALVPGRGVDCFRVHEAGRNVLREGEFACFTTAQEEGAAPKRRARGGRAREKSQRNCRHRRLTSAEAVDFLGITQDRIARMMSGIALGVSPPAPRESLRPTFPQALYLASMRRRYHPHERTADSRARQLKEGRPGRVLAVDVSPEFGNSIDGFCYFLLLVCVATDRLFFQPMKDKSAKSVLAAIENVRLFILTAFPGPWAPGKGGPLETIFGDGDGSYTRHVHGDDRDTTEARAYTAATGVGFERTPPHCPNKSRAEPAMKALFGKMAMIAYRQNVNGNALWDDIGEGATAQLNAVPVPTSETSMARTISRNEAFSGQRDDLSRWLGPPLCGCYVTRQAGKVNRFRELALSALFICPARGFGFLVRMLGGGQRKVVSFYVAVPKHQEDTLSAALVASPALFKQHGVQAGAEERSRRVVRDMFRKHEDEARGLEAMFARFDPLGVPYALVPALNDAGDLVFAQEGQCTEDGAADTGHAAGTDTDTPATAANGGTAGAVTVGARAGQRSEPRGALPCPPRHAVVGRAGAPTETMQQGDLEREWSRISAARPPVWRKNEPLEKDTARFFRDLFAQVRAGDSEVCFQQPSGGKKDVKRGTSLRRYRAYAGASTLRDFLAKHAAHKSSIEASKDLANDFLRHLVEVHLRFRDDPAPAPGSGPKGKASAAVLRRGTAPPPGPAVAPAAAMPAQPVARGTGKRKGPTPNAAATTLAQSKVTKCKHDRPRQLGTAPLRKSERLVAARATAGEAAFAAADAEGAAETFGGAEAEAVVVTADHAVAEAVADACDAAAAAAADDAVIADAAALDHLCKRAPGACATALCDLKQHGRKTQHWAWWVFPCVESGWNEPGPKTYLTTETAVDYLGRAPASWQVCLQQVVELTRRGRCNPTLEDVLMPADMERVWLFIQLWEAVGSATPAWLTTVCRRLREAAEADRGRAADAARDERLAQISAPYAAVVDAERLEGRQHFGPGEAEQAGALGALALSARGAPAAVGPKPGHVLVRTSAPGDGGAASAVWVPVAAASATETEPTARGGDGEAHPSPTRARQRKSKRERREARDLRRMRDEQDDDDQRFEELKAAKRAERAAAAGDAEQLRAKEAAEDASHAERLKDECAQLRRSQGPTAVLATEPPGVGVAALPSEGGSPDPLWTALCAPPPSATSPFAYDEAGERARRGLMRTDSTLSSEVAQGFVGGVEVPATTSELATAPPGRGKGGEIAGDGGIWRALEACEAQAARAADHRYALATLMADGIRNTIVDALAVDEPSGRPGPVRVRRFAPSPHASAKSVFSVTSEGARRRALRQTEAARKIDQLLRDAQPAEVDDLPSRMTALRLRNMAVSASTLPGLELAAIELDFRYRTTHGGEPAAAAAAYFAGDGAPDEETQRALRDWAMDEFTNESAARYAPAREWDAGDESMVSVGAGSGDSRTEYVDALAALRGSEAAPGARAAFVARVAVLGAPDDHAEKFVAHVQGLPDAAAFVGTAAAVGEDGGPLFTSVRGAMRRSDWEGEGGFKEAVQAEIDRVMRHYQAAEYVPYSEVRKARQTYGAEKVSIKNVVFPGKCKHNASGVVTRRKARWTIADRVADEKIAGTFSATVAASSQRLLSQLLVFLPGAVASTSDVAGAYFNGKPKAPEEEGGRVLFTPVPAGWEQFGYPEHDEHNNRMFFKITGNMPGRQEAGAVWGEEYTAKLLAWGFQQSVVDRRVFYQFDEEGRALIVGVFVDDNWILSQSPQLLQEFTANWVAEYDGAPDMAATTNEFCGVGMERKEDGSIELHVDGTIDALAVSLEPFMYDGPRDVPMADGGLRAIKAPPSPDNPLMPAETSEAARRIMGRGGWIVSMVRPDAFFAYTALATQLGTNFTKNVWEGVLQWAHYMVNTKALRLTYRRPTAGAKWVTFSDSSLMNAGDGEHYGGFCSGYEGSGILNWRCFVPRRLSDSSAAAELVVATAALKWTLGQRMLCEELRQGQGGPTPLYLDAQAALQGVASEKVARDMKYMAARYAIMRQSVRAGEVVLCKVHTHDNLADMFTKPLVGEAFRRLRARIMGLEGWRIHSAPSPGA